MRKMLGALVAVGVLGAAGLAFAAGSPVTATGKIRSIDMLRHTVTFEDGSTYKLARGVRTQQDEGGRTSDAHLFRDGRPGLGGGGSRAGG